jgi:ABC-type dipeptide/oligopeptide/nickel transport system permease subunit
MTGAAWRRIRTADGMTLCAGGWTLLLVAVALLGPLAAPHSPYASDAATLQPPSLQHWAGTDETGRDVFSRLIVATRTDLAIAAAAVLASFAVGTATGAFCGYFGGLLDGVVGRLVDVLMAFPLFVLGMALVAAVGAGLASIIVATAIINLPLYIRLARSEVNARRGFGWVEAARLSGNSHTRVVLCFLLPNILPMLMVQVSLNLGWAILNAAGLSFLGLGVQPPTPEWGVMVAEGAKYISDGQWWLVAFPGVTLALAVLGFNLLGDGLRDRLDPRGRRA